MMVLVQQIHIGRQSHRSLVLHPVGYHVNIVDVVVLKC